MRTVLLGFAMASALSVSSAQASVIDSDSVYLMNVHFGNNSYGRPVASVTAHVGVQTELPDFTGQPMRWQDVKDVTLSSDGTGFTGRVTLAAHGCAGSLTTTLTPMVQYFVRFSDGGEMISQPFAVPSSENYLDMRYYSAEFVAAARTLVERAEPVSETRVLLKGISYGTGSAVLDEALQASGVLALFPR